MKQKSRLFLNIATIALCLCAIIVGVYSAKTASLNVGGQVGFVAHDCKVDVVGKITDASSGGTEGTYYVTEKSSESDSPTLLTSADSAKISLGGTNAQTKLATFGNLMFTYDDNHDPKPIVIEFTITNNSAFDIKATLATTSLTPYDSSKVTISVQNNEAEISPNRSEIVKLTITLDKNVSTDINNVVTGNINFDFEKCTPLLQYDSSIGWHINMGKVTSTLANAVNNHESAIDLDEGMPIPWIPVIEVTQNNGTTTLTAFNGKLQDNKPQKGHTYYFWSYYNLSCVYGNTLAVGMIYSNYGFVGTDYDNAYASYNDPTSSNNVSLYTTTQGDHIPISDYSVSNVRTYLNGGTAYKAQDSSVSGIIKPMDSNTQLVNFLDLYSLSTDEVYNSKITPRTLQDLYSNIKFEGTSATVPELTSPITVNNTVSDKLWLLSRAEGEVVYNSVEDHDSFSNMTAGTLGYQGYDQYFSRTPGLDDDYVYSFHQFYTFAGPYNTYNAYCIRPAFKIVI